MKREISEKEFAVIREISNNELPDQRTIATKTGFSLGLTNLIIKRLVKTGYIKLKQLNRRKIQYILTPKGFTEKAKKSYKYTLKTINLFRVIKEKIQELITNYYHQGVKNFIIVGNNELAELAELAFSALKFENVSYSRINNNSLRLDKKNDCVYLIASDGSFTLVKKSSRNRVDLIDYLANSGIYF